MKEWIEGEEKRGEKNGIGDCNLSTFSLFAQDREEEIPSCCDIPMTEGQKVSNHLKKRKENEK